jgi:lipoyl(octanoyl) transferase
MAVDEALLEAVRCGDSGPVLRLYAWDPPCLSLGYGQKWTDADSVRLAERGWGLVRRPTGGRAILHTDELTYSITLPEDHPLAQGDILDSYRRISQALLAGLGSLGLETQAERRAERRVQPGGPVCFETPSHYEVTTPDGRKVIGSAQTRRRGGVLQHGTIPLHGDLGRICDALAFADEPTRQRAREAVHRRAATLADALDGQVLDWQMTADAIVRGFETAFELEFVPGDLTPAETEHAVRLAETVYGIDAWLKRL